MSRTWTSPHPPPAPRPEAGARLLGVLRAAAIAVLVLLGLFILLPIRAIEHLTGGGRTASAYVPMLTCRLALVVLGLRVTRRGHPSLTRGAIVANHASWLDILVLNAQAPLVFVAKSEVSAWPGIGWLARRTGTVFVAREAREAQQQAAHVAARIAAGDLIAFFPEGTSSDGQQVLPFNPTLFEALITAGTPVQPVSLRYTAPPGQEARFFGWWGDMEFAAHAGCVLALASGGRVDVAWQAPIDAASGNNRKALARQAEDLVRAGFVSPLRR